MTIIPRNQRFNSSPTEAIEPYPPNQNEDEEDEVSPNNSEDEYRNDEDNGAEYWDQKERDFLTLLKSDKRFYLKEMHGDGSCLFRAVSDQVYGDQEMHDVVRENVCNYMQKNAEFFAPFVSEDFGHYLDRKRLRATPGNHLEMQAMAELYNRPFEVYEYSLAPINTFQVRTALTSPPIRVSYHRRSHYNSFRKSFEASIGVGLGLPGHRPGMAEEKLVSDTLEASKNDGDNLEQRMLQDKIAASDLEATTSAMQEEVQRQSYLEWVQRMDTQVGKGFESDPFCYLNRNSFQDCKKPRFDSNEASCSTSRKSTSTSKRQQTRSPPKSKPSSPLRNPVCDETTPTGLNDADFVTDATEQEILRQILALSEQDYYNSLKKSGG